MKRFRSLVVVLALALSVMVPGVGRANQDPGVGVFAFECQTSIYFPSITPLSATPCDGVAEGAWVGANKDAGSIAVGLPSTAKKPSGQGAFVNFEAYNIVYAEVCPAGQPLGPPLNGTAWVMRSLTFSIPSLARPMRS